MKKPSIFPSLPKNLSVTELRREIRRRLKISDQLGLIRKPKKWLAVLRRGLATLAKSRHFKERQGVDFMEGCPCLGEIIRITSTVIAPRNREDKLLKAMHTLSSWNLCWFGLKWLSQSGVSGIRWSDVFAFLFAKVFASLWKHCSAINVSIRDCLQEVVTIKCNTWIFPYSSFPEK